VVDSKDGEDGIDGRVSKRERFGGGLQGQSRTGWALLNHGSGGLDGNNQTVSGLIGTRPGTDVDDGPCVVQGLDQPLGDTGVRPSRRCVGTPDGVVSWLAHAITPGHQSAWSRWVVSFLDNSETLTTPAAENFLPASSTSLRPIPCRRCPGATTNL